jgi:cytochrome P450
LVTEPFNYDALLISADDPYPIYKRMRDEDPAHYSATENIWVITRFDDVAAAFRDWKTWSSQRRGNLLHDRPERIGLTLGTTDPPAHETARGLVDQAFTTGTVEAMRSQIASLVARLVAEAREKGAFEFVADISAPFNAAVLGGMFGVPEADFIRLRRWLDDFFLSERASEGVETKQTVAMRNLREYVHALAEERMTAPSNDLLSAMLVAEDNGSKLAPEQVVMTTMTFLTAGFESVNNLFTNLSYALAVHPGVWTELRSNLELVPQFVEEAMRWDSPAQGFVRSPTREIELHGKTIAENAQVLLHIGAANRDERNFENPDVLDIHRPKQRHLAMGMGVHFCVGAPLGRTMAQLLFGELIKVSRRWEVDTANATRVKTPNFRGFSKLPTEI